MAKLERKKEQERHKAELAAELLKRGANVAAEESKVSLEKMRSSNMEQHSKNRF